MFLNKENNQMLFYNIQMKFANEFAHVRNILGLNIIDSTIQYLVRVILQLNPKNCKSTNHG